MSKKFRLPKHIGVIHLPALPGAPLSGSWQPAAVLQKAGARAIDEAKKLQKAGFDGLILENFGDAPFYKDAVPRETVASLSILAAAIKEVVSISVGINVLRNDAFSALAIASVTGCEFIRVNVLSGVAATDQGIIEGKAARLLREKERLGSNVKILADVQVKHARSLSSQGLEQSIEEAIQRAGADAVILTGSGTGKEVDSEELEQAYQITRKLKAPLYIGSGVTPENWNLLQMKSSGMIIGSYIRSKGQAGAPLDTKRLQGISQLLRGERKRSSK